MATKLSNEKYINLFSQLGLILNDGQETANVLKVDQRIFQTNLRNYLNKNSNEFENLKSFLITDYFEKNVNFIIALLPTNNDPNMVVSHSSNQDNLIKLLIEIEKLQSDLFDFLIEKATNLSLMSDLEDGNSFELIMNVINQFRYQPKINEPEILCEKLLAMVTSITSITLKIDIISCFPDILSDSSHDDIAIKLSEFLVENELSHCILETLSNLKLNEKTNVQIVEKLFEIYGVMSENDLHSVVKFILKSSNVLNSAELLDNLLLKVTFDDIEKEENRFMIYEVLKEYFQISDHLTDLFISITNKNLTESNDQGNDEDQPANPKIRKFQSIDFIIFNIIYSFPQQFKQIDKLLKQLIKEDSTVAQQIEKSIINTLKSGNIMLKELFNSIILIAKSLIQSPFSSVSSIGKCIYKYGFEFYDKKFKNKIITILVDQITCSSDNSRDNSLDILEDLCIKNIDNVVSYSMEIKTLLDFIEYFNLNQIRKLYFIVCSIAYSSSDSDSSIKSNNNIQDNLHILINKQLASNILKYKQIGVIGALMMIKCMSSPRTKSNTNEIKHIWQMIIDSSKSSPESLGLFEDDLTSLLKKESIPADVETLIKENLKEITSGLFKLDVNYDSKLKFFNDKLAQFKIGHEFGLDERTNGCLNLITQLMNDFLKKNSSLILNRAKTSDNLPAITIASTFRLISALERKNTQVELNEYLGLPILTIKKEDLYKYGNLLNDENNSSSYYMKFRNILTDDEKKILCDTVFYLINWFIELVNSFSFLININEDLDDMYRKLLDRLNCIYELQEVLKNLLPYMKYYRPPMAIFGLVDMSVEELPYVHSLIKLKDNTKSTKKPKMGGKRKKQDKKVTKKSKKPKKKNDDENMDEDENKENEIEDEYLDEKELVSDSDDDTTVVESDESNFSSQIDLSKISIYFREFDLCVINFLNFKLDLNGSKVIPDSAKRNMSSINEDSNIQIAPHLLCFVLNDFNKKLPLVLKSDNIKVSVFGGGGGVSSSIGQSAKPSKMQTFLQLNTIDPKHLVKLIMNNCFSSLCDHLDDIYKHVKQIQSKNDNLQDPPELFTNTNNLNLLSCFNQLLKTIYNLFLWLSNASNTVENKEICLEMIKQIGSKLVVSTNASTQVEKSPETFCLRYLYDLREVIVDLETGDILIKIMNLLINKIFPKYSNSKMNDPKKICKIIYTACKKFLYDDYNPKLALNSTRQTNNEAVINMLNTLLSSNEFDKSLKVAVSLCEIINGEEYMENRQNCSDINTLKNHFLQYFKVLIEYSVNNLKFVSKYDLKRLSADVDLLKEIVEKIKLLTKMNCDLINLKKNVSYKEINMLTLLKNSKLFINNFLKYTMPWLDQAFEYMKEDVVNLLQELQTTIQYLQKVCQTSQNTAIAKQTPVYMRLVETFSLRVRQLLYVNRCDDAFIVNLFQNKVLKKSAAKGKKNEAKKSTKGKTKVEVDEETTNDNDQEEDVEEEEEEEVDDEENESEEQD
jgi:hypothetical protein